MEGVTISRIDRKSSIDSEPRTLNFREIDIAREAALYVMHTRSREEACQIFTEGLERVETQMMPLMTKEHGLYSSTYSRVLKRRSLKHVLTAPF